MPPSATTELTPIIVTAPAIRCGTTLVQRLLCSARNARIYGEACGQDLELLLGAFTAKAMLYRHHGASYAARRAGVEAGEVNDWILDLMPDLEGYAAALQGGVLAGLRFCRDEADAAGRPAWGFKIPGWTPPTVRLVRRLLPLSWWVVVERDLEGCLRSAKAWQPMPGLADVQDFCRAWATSTAFWRGLGPDPAVLRLDYATFIADPAAGLRRLAAFTGAEGMDPEIFGHKVNTTRDRGVYVPPAALTEAERQVVRETQAAIAVPSPASGD